MKPFNFLMHRSWPWFLQEEEMGGIEGNQLMANNQMDDYSEDDSSDDD